MRSLLIRIALFASIYSLCCFSCARAQDLAQTLQLGQHLQEIRDFEGAIDLYRRVIFFDRAQAHHLPANLAMAECHWALGEAQEALKCLNLAYYQSKNAAQRLNIQFRQIEIHLLMQDFVRAQEELYSVEGERDSTHAAKFHLYSGIAWFGTGQYDSSQVYFHRYIGPGNALAHAEIDRAFDQTRRLAKIRPVRAKVMSTILPGLGQLYYGDVKNGLNSFLLTSGLLILGLHLAIVISPFDALLTVGPWYYRYYQGGVRRAGEIAAARRERKRAIIYQQLFDALDRCTTCPR